ncbi:Fur family transcriptional regulator [Paracoccus zhejiangensis]|uniref:Fur family transcriptional regulator n=1 Tax=Paracoccus zhejiangensis TaxID=1077935 RepID=A0A2H5F2S6_9RHOB|nr:Fur family transcriptional regulator [Paracoccus zhejiangensis]AUH65860.1 Fur family transcriptional regulator [Paracoccus zhejiangensis]
MSVENHAADDAATAFASHDHSTCRTQALQAADDLAAEQGVRLTPVRRRTLEILLETHRALGAYEVLERLGAEGFGSQPPVAYRALDFLVQHGLAHRVQRLNAFAACLSPGHDHAPAFLICRACNKVAEADAPEIRSALRAAAGGVGFSVERMTVEALGLCDACAAVEQGE